MQLSSEFTCTYCLKQFTSESNLNRHKFAKLSKCYQIHQEVLNARAATLPTYDPYDPTEVPCDDEPAGGYEMGQDGIDEDPYDSHLPEPPEPPELSFNQIRSLEALNQETQIDVTSRSDTDQSAAAIGKRIVKPPRNRSQTYGRSLTCFEFRKLDDEGKGLSPFGTFESAEAFEHAEWSLSSEISQNTESKLLRTRLVSHILTLQVQVTIPLLIEYEDEELKTTLVKCEINAQRC